jgi:hypothetical protein
MIPNGELAQRGNRGRVARRSTSKHAGAVISTVLIPQSLTNSGSHDTTKEPLSLANLKEIYGMIVPTLLFGSPKTAAESMDQSTKPLLLLHRV